MSNDAVRDLDSDDHTPRWAAAADRLLELGLGAFLAWTVLYEVALWRGWSGWSIAWAWIPLGLLAGWLVVRLAHLEGGAPDDAPGPTWRSHGVVAAVGSAISVGYLFVLQVTEDDIYYVNRSVWVEERGLITAQDTLFSPGTLPSIYGGGNITSIEAWYGAVAHLLHVHASTMVYLVAAPVLSLAAVWSSWRLVRLWTRRRALLVLMVALGVYVALGSALLGDFWVPRIWQGKVLAVAVLAPLVLWWMTVLLRATSAADRRRAVAMLALCGAAYAALTSTAGLMSLGLASSFLVAGLLVRRPLRAVSGAVALVFFPLAATFAVLITATGTVGGTAEMASDGDVSRQAAVFRSIGRDWRVHLVVVLGLALGPLSVRSREARAVAWGTGVFVAVLMLPGVLPLLGVVDGVRPVLGRLMLTPPVAVLVGLLVALPTRRWLAAVVTAVLALVLAFSAIPSWSPAMNGRVASTPVWKVPPGTADTVREVLAVPRPDGPLLLPEPYMRVLPLVTTRAFAVVPRDYYLQALHEPEPARAARETLLGFATAGAPLPDTAEVASALDELDVALVCLNRSRQEARLLMKEVGYERPVRAGGLVCLRPPLAGAPDVRP